MSNIRLQGNPSGTGTLTIASPNTNSDFTLNLPTANGTIPLLATVTNNGVMFINGSGQPTTGTALTFDGTNLGIGTAAPPNLLTVQTAATGTTAGSNVIARLQSNASGRDATLQFSDNVANSSTVSMVSGATVFRQNGVESVRIDSSGNMLVGTTTNTNSSRIVSNGVIESTSGGVRFPDGTTQTTAAGALTTTAVLNAIAGASLGAVGTYAYLAHNTFTAVTPGQTIAGSVMRYAGGISQLTYASTNTISSQGATPAGTWRCMGNAPIAAVCAVTAIFGSVFLRIS